VENFVFFAPIGEKFAFFDFARNINFLVKKWEKFRRKLPKKVQKNRKLEIGIPVT
jgi:hypothetical protein